MTSPTVTAVSELKPCPFCGECASVDASSGSDERNGYNFKATAQCGTCHASVSVASNHDKLGWCCEGVESAKARAIEAWNRRSALADVGELFTLPPEAVELMRYRMRMSYNDSYFGEPAGLVKRAVAALERRTGKQPRPAAEWPHARCHGSNKVWQKSQDDVISVPCIGCPDCSPAAECLVAGDVMTLSIAQYVMRAEALIRDEQASASPNNALLGFLCESVRLARETRPAAHTAQVSERQRDALEYGAYCIEKHTGVATHEDAAELRRLAEQGSGSDAI